MPNYLFKFTENGVERYENYFSKIPLSKHKQIKAAKKLYFKNIKISIRELKENNENN